MGRIGPGLEECFKNRGAAVFRSQHDRLHAVPVRRCRLSSCRQEGANQRDIVVMYGPVEGRRPICGRLIHIRRTG